jgi:predicted dehydrogenase
MKNKTPQLLKSESTISAFAGAAFTVVPRSVLGGNGYNAPSDKLNIACIGVGGMGYHDLKNVSSENVVALCDVDLKRSARAFNEYPSTRKYRDYREMLVKEQDLDAVTVTTPDHNHAIIAMTAIKMGLHTYCQKPLTHTIYEARQLALVAAEKNVITQMGNQGHAGEGIRLIKEWIQAGAVGNVSEVHCWTNRPDWPQGMGRPHTEPAMPPTLNWELWLGPSPYRPYHPAYLPADWRGWWDFGTGAIGDMGAHIMDVPYWVLDLEYPETVQASSTKINEETYPLASIITYQFPAGDHQPKVKMMWYDGGIMPKRPNDLEPGRKMGDSDGGVLFIGDEGKIMCGCYGSNPRIIPEKKMKAFKQPEKTIPRSPGIHAEWIQACKNNTQATSNFKYAGKLTETMLLGNLAIRLSNENRVFEWDGPNLQISNFEKANKYLHFEYRQGWTL